ncbi:uncharacterized protein [Oscarella lobularis]|uniref:uncharacterized protein isoform X2 n=1 Tax=Oscarella lobularis TaxID=121494 RepID=UPI0033132897
MPRSSLLLLLLLALEFASGLRVDVHRAEGRDRRTPDVDVESESNRYLTLRVDKNDGTNPWLLDLEESSKDFLSSRFVTRHFDASNTEVLTREYPACHYRGRLRDAPDSHVVISTCGGINGIIHDGKRTYNIQPDNDGAESSHLLSESASDEIASHCGVNHQSFPSLKPPNQHHHYVAKRSPIYPYTVEVTFVADIDLYKNVKENVTELQTILLRFANVISAIYKRSDQGVRVVLIAIEVWSNGNQAVVLSDFKTTLKNFVTYNGDTLQKDPLFKSDNTQLLTGIDFTGTIKGLANVKTICQGRTSAAVVEVYSLIGADVAGIMAHEMGHNFGMQHDEDILNCECSDPYGCVMSAILSGRERNFTFSECSRATLKLTLDEGQGSCLTNLPEKMEGPVVCGNGFVESDEWCDCGTVEECAQANDMCCNPRTCTFNAGAVCSDADDACCENCQFSAVGTLCRSAKGDCDLEEVCTGVSARCPTNLYKYDGTNCTGVDENDMGICYRGVCNTRTVQCRDFWGPDAVTGSSRCYRTNLDGRFYGHCGGNPTDGYIPCEEANVMCGKLQCLSPLEKPTVSRAWRSASYRIGSETCRSVSVTVEDDERDPGLVGDGTTCGNGMICILNKCVDVPTASAQCPQDDAGRVCSSNGICSSAGTCICSGGFELDDCSRKSDVPTTSVPCPEDDAGRLCSNNGICSSAGTCVCSDGFTSDDCSRHSASTGGGGNAGNVFLSTKEIAEEILSLDGQAGIVEAVKEVRGSPSAAKDDSVSIAICPSGFVISNCRCSVANCDGVIVSSTVCRAYASYLSGSVTAVAVCTKYKDGSVDFIYTRTPATSYNVPARVNSFTCPEGYRLLTCNTHTYWYRTPSFGLATTSGNKCSFDCKTTTKACVLYTACFKRIDSLPSVSIAPSTEIIMGPLSEARDDSPSKAQCPSGFIVASCRCSIVECDGVIMGDTWCTAYTSYLRKRVQALATCVKYGLNSVSISRIKLPTSGFSKSTLSYTCPTGTSLLSCNTHTYWYKKGVSGLADTNSRTCSINCALIHSGRGCSLYVKCLKRIDSLPSVNIASSTEIIMGPLSEACDDSPSKAQCPSGFIVASCRCSIVECDGVIMGDTWCTAYTSHLRKRVQAVATCVKYGLNSVSISRIKLPTSGFSTGTLSYTCPTGTSLLSCNTHTYWYKKGVSGLADVNSRTCSINCALIHSGRGCNLYVKCLKNLID